MTLTQHLNRDTIREDFQKFARLDPQRKVMILGLIFGLFLVALIVGSYISRQGPSGPSGGDQATVTVPPAQNVTILELDPATASLAVGEAQEVQVTLEQLPVTAVDIILQYDTDVLTVSGLENGDVFSRLIKNRVDATEGQIVYSASVDPSGETPPQTGTVFTFTITPKAAAAQTLITFDPIGTITALNGDNTLGQTVGGEFSVE